MGLMVLKQMLLLFILVSASLLSCSFAGRQLMFMDKPTMKVNANDEEISRRSLHHDKATDAHERILRANTKDYGNYNPAPALVKPPFKLIPN